MQSMQSSNNVMSFTTNSSNSQVVKSLTASDISDLLSWNKDPFYCWTKLFMKPDNAYQKFEFSRAFLERVSALILGARYVKKEWKQNKTFFLR